ncbi:MAG: hypothetical protein FWG30_02745 [Eubacteriaceae bacterium]|nr:hypothetical protein [Eubacteriaceae bacterium]
MSVLEDLAASESALLLSQAQEALGNAAEKHGFEARLPYTLQLMHALRGISVLDLSDLQKALYEKPEIMPAEGALGSAFNEGLYALLWLESLQALEHMDDAEAFSLNYMPDADIRDLAVPLARGDVPAIALIIGQTKDDKAFEGLVRKYQESGAVVFLAGSAAGQAKNCSIKGGKEYRVFSFASCSQAFAAILRFAEIFSESSGGSISSLFSFSKSSLPVFLNILGEVSGIAAACAASCMALGFPAIAEAGLGSAYVPTAYESSNGIGKMADISFRLRGIEAVERESFAANAYSPSFQNEAVMPGELHAQLGWPENSGFLLFFSRSDWPGNSQVETKGYGLIDGSSLSILVECHGPNIEHEFELFAEKQLSIWINRIEGVSLSMNFGSATLRISKAAYDKGFTDESLGQSIYSQVIKEYGDIVSKCRVTIITEQSLSENIEANVAAPLTKIRSERLSELTDENVKLFYACTACRKYQSSHFCAITPEKPGICGAVDYYSAYSEHALSKGNSPSIMAIAKGEASDALLGRYAEVDATLEKGYKNVAIYSLMQDPMPSIGAFECISAVEPSTSGVLAVPKDYSGATPMGLRFSELAFMASAAKQAPGAMGHSKSYIASKKYLQPEGGIIRVVWMPKSLKDEYRDEINLRAKELTGIEDFAEMICDESIGVTLEELKRHLQDTKHPVSTMPILV